MRGWTMEVTLPSRTELGLCAGGAGELLHGWEKQFDFLAAKWADVDLAERRPQVIWRGRTEDKEYPKRDELRCCPCLPSLPSLPSLACAVSPYKGVAHAKGQGCCWVRPKRNDSGAAPACSARNAVRLHTQA
jgi:hypothetical protein